MCFKAATNRCRSMAATRTVLFPDRGGLHPSQSGACGAGGRRGGQAGRLPLEQSGGLCEGKGPPWLEMERVLRSFELAEDGRGRRATLHGWKRGRRQTVARSMRWRRPPCGGDGIWERRHSVIGCWTCSRSQRRRRAGPAKRPRSTARRRRNGLRARPWHGWGFLKLRRSWRHYGKATLARFWWPA